MYESPVPLKAAAMKGAFRWRRLGGRKEKALRWWTWRRTLEGGGSRPDRGCGTR